MPLPGSNVRTSAGTSVSISATLPTAYTEAAYLAVTDAVKIGLVSEVGEFGRTYQDVTFNPLETRGTVHRKGSYDEGQLPLQIARDVSDEGQQLLVEASQSDDLYTIILTLQDGTRQFYTGQVYTSVTNVGNVNSITMRNATIQLESGSGIEVQPVATP